MSFCGAWSLSEAPAAALLPRAEREAMREALGLGGAAPQEVEHGPLWLAGDPRRLACDDGRWIAVEGFLASARSPSAELAAASDGELRVDGHYVIAYADPRRRLLRFWRDPSGAERLFFARRGPLLLFSSSIKPLLACSPASGVVDPGALFEARYSDLVCFGDQTLWPGVREVLCGHLASLEDGELRQRWHWGELLRGESGDPRALAAELRRRLGAAVAAALGEDREAVVSLSGGMDSAAVAALAADAVGARNVQAVTFEFDDPSHRSESARAASICRALGLARHTVVRITRREYEDAVPEILWRSEHFNEWQRPDALIVARRLRASGVSKFLTGTGVGSHMAYFEELESALRWLPAPGLTLRCWAAAHHGGAPLDWLRTVHPGLEPPAGWPRFRLYLLLLYTLHHRGLVPELAPFFPPPLREPALATAGSARVRDAVRALDGLPLGRALQRLALTHGAAQVDISRGERVARSLGVAKVSPAFFPSCLPLTYFPFAPKPPLGSRARAARPGKHLLTLAFRGRLPDEVLDQRKDWSTGYIPRAWHSRALAAFGPPAGPGPGGEGRRLHLAYQRLWERLFAGASVPARPPLWKELEAASAEVRA